MQTGNNKRRINKTENSTEHNAERAGDTCMQIITSKRRITVEHATAQDEKVLAMDSYDCVAVVTNQTFNASGMLFEFTQSRHQPDYFCFQDIATRKK